MQLSNIIYYHLPEEATKKIWEDCVFIFDTSALLDLYYFSKKSQDDIFQKIFKTIKGRLWLPHHVGYEYLKLREETIIKPIAKDYKELKEIKLKAIKEEIKSILDKVKDFKQRTEKEYHPYINIDITNSFQNICNDFETKYVEFEKMVCDDLKKREQEIELFLDNDTVMDTINNYFDVGKEYLFDKIMKIVEEGNIRYRSKIPPGYEDEKGKSGIQIYGDLIIWKQIIDYAKEVQKPIVFILNDVKEDWCIFEKKGNEKRIKMPNEDLSREMMDEAGTEILMYTFSQFLFFAKSYLNTNVEEAVIEEAKSIDKSKYIPLSGLIKLFGTSNIIEILNNIKLSAIDRHNYNINKINSSDDMKYYKDRNRITLSDDMEYYKYNKNRMTKSAMEYFKYNIDKMTLSDMEDYINNLDEVGLSDLEDYINNIDKRKVLRNKLSDLDNDESIVNDSEDKKENED